MMNEFSNMIPKASGKREELKRSSEFDEKVKREIEWQNERINKAIKEGKNYTSFVISVEVEDYIKEMYKKQGYTFKPTGYVGGVWQRTEDICW